MNWRRQQFAEIIYLELLRSVINTDIALVLVSKHVAKHETAYKSV